MQHIYFGLLSLVLFTQVIFAEDCDWDNEKHTYIKLCSGITFSEISVEAPFPFWDFSPQGYNSNIGDRPIMGVGLGYELFPHFSVDLIASYRPQFKYRKFQSPTFEQSHDSPGFLGSKTREFDLNLLTLLINFYLDGRNMDYFCWQPACWPGSFYPILGGGVGISQATIYNFRSTGLPPVVEPPEPSFSSENQYSLSNTFTYQLMIGIEYRYEDCWAFSFGYRWVDAGTFKGPRYFRDQIGKAYDSLDNQWKINFRASELFIELKWFL